MNQVSTSLSDCTVARRLNVLEIRPRPAAGLQRTEAMAIVAVLVTLWETWRIDLEGNDISPGAYVYCSETSEFLAVVQ